MTTKLHNYLTGAIAGIVLLAILLTATLAKCQDTRKVRDEYTINGKPTFTPPTVPSYSDDLWNKQVWKFQNKTVGWILETDSAIIKVRLGLGTKGEKGDKGDTGPQGPQGPPGVSTSGPLPGIIFVTPSNSPNTFRQNGWTQNSIDQLFPGAGGTLDDAVDKIMLTYCFLKAQQTHEPLWMWGTYLTNGSSFIQGIYSHDLVVHGNGAFIRSTTAGVYTLLKRYREPTSIPDAENNFLNTRFIFSNITFQCMFPGQTGFDTGPTNSSIFSSVNGHGGAYGGKVVFSLNILMSACTFKNNSEVGLSVIRLATPDYNGLNGNGNAAVFQKIQCVSPNTGGKTALYFKDVGDLLVDCPTIEGYGYDKGIHIDGRVSNSSKGAMIRLPWFEFKMNHTDIKNQAMIFIEMVGGSVVIDGGIQIASNDANIGLGIFCHAGSTVGLLCVTVQNVTGWGPFETASGNKYFYNDGTQGGSCTWKLKLNTDFGPNASIVPGTFTGTPVTVGPTGNNTVSFEPM